MKSESQNTLPTTIESGKDSSCDMSDGNFTGAIALPDGPSIDTLSITPDAVMENDDVAFESTVVPGVVGLQNIGNTCFMNSTLQCLLHCRPLCEYFLSGKYREEINECNPLGTGGKLAREFAKLVDMFWNEPTDQVITPRELKWVIAQHAPMFSGYQQQDSQELVTFLLDGLHEDLNLVKEKAYTEVIEANDRPDELVAKLCWEQHLLRNRSRVVDLFQGQYKSRLQCPICKKCSVTFDPFMYLSLPIPSYPDLSICVTFSTLSASNLSPVRLAVNVFRDSADLVQSIQAAVAAELPEEYAESIVTDEILVYWVQEKNGVFQQIDGSNFYITSSLAASKRKVFCTFAPPRIALEDGPKRVRNSGILICVQIRLTFPDDNQKNASVGCPTAFRVSRDISGLDLFNEINRAVTHQIGPRNHGLVTKKTAVARVLGVEGECVSCGFSESEFEAWWGSPCEWMSSKSLLNICVEVPSDDLEGDSEASDVVSSIQSRMTDSYYRTQISWKSAAVNFHPPARGGEPLSIMECFKLFASEEVLSAEDQWYCSACKVHVQASKKIDLWTLPEILIIHLKRFQYARGFRNKIESVIDFPAGKEDFLNLSEFLPPSTSQVPASYRLFAISNHMGSLYSGHYTAFADLRGDSNEWYSFNDSSVNPLHQEPRPDSSAYLLFYQRLQ